MVYSLVSLINHMGPSQNCGHYTAMAKAANGQVYLFDDASVSGGQAPKSELELEQKLEREVVEEEKEIEAETELETEKEI